VPAQQALALGAGKAVPGANGGSPLADPALMLGGLVGLGAVVGGAAYMVSRGMNDDGEDLRVIETLQDELADAEEAFFAKAAAEGDLEREFSSALSMLAAEKAVAAEARAALEAAEAKVAEIEESSAGLSGRAQTARKEAARSWIERWQASSRLNGTMKVYAKKQEEREANSFF